MFAYKHFIGIKSDLKAEGLLNDPSQPGQLGFVVKARSIEISKEAMELLKLIPKSGDCIGDIDIHESNAGPIFNWLGGPWALLNTRSEISGSRDYDPSLLDGVVTIVKNNPPKDFIKVCDKK